MKISICLILCLLVFAGCIARPHKKSSKETIDDRMKDTIKESTKELEEEAKQLRDAYKKYKNAEMKPGKFSEVK